jgi:hypothetical protein
MKAIFCFTLLWMGASLGLPFFHASNYPPIKTFCKLNFYAATFATFSSDLKFLGTI